MWSETINHHPVMSYLKKNPNLFKRIIFSRGMALAIILAVVFVGYGLVSLLEKSIDASKGRKIAESQAADLSRQQQDLSKKLADLNTADGQEAALREQFPVVKEGEHVVVITGGDSQDISIAATLSTEPAQKSFWDFLKNLFKK